MNQQHALVIDDNSKNVAILTRLLAETCYDDYHLVASAAKSPKGGVADVHNLVILSRRPAHESEALHHRLVPPLPYRSLTAEPESARDLTLEWDRPLLHAAFETENGETLHVINLHLRSPLASPKHSKPPPPSTSSSAAQATASSARRSRSSRGTRRRHPVQAAPPHGR